MTGIAIWRAGMRRASRAPLVLGLLWVLTLLVALPPALTLRDEIATHLDDSLAADAAADGVNYDWMQEFRAQATPLGRSLRPDTIGFAVVMDNASALADGSRRPAVAIVASVMFVLALWFVTPGIICRLAVDDSLGASGFLACCGACLGRMLRLNLGAAVVYGTLFGSFHTLLFDDVFDAVTHDLTVERTAFIIRLGLYAVFFLLVGAANLLFDIARVRMVVEDRRSAAHAVAAALHFLARHARLAVSAYALNVVTLATIVGLYALLAPGAGGSGAGMWAGVLVGQAYIVARLLVKLAFWGSGVAALQATLAYPGFVRARPNVELPFDKMQVPFTSA